MSNHAHQHPPAGWKSATLGQVSECILGGTPSTEVPKFWGGDVPWMASGDVHLRRIQDVPGRITALGLRSSNATLTTPPAVAVGLAGQGKTRGTVALTLCTLSTNQSIALLKANGIDLRTDYLFHNLDRRYEELRARSSGGGRGGLSKAILEAVPIDLPPLSEQKRIALILDTLDTGIHETEAIIAKLKALKQGLLHDLLTRGIGENGELRPPQAEAPHLYKESPLGWIPKEWVVDRIGALSTYVGSGLTPTGGSKAYVSSGILFIRSQNVHFDGLHLEDAAYISMHTHLAMNRSALEPFDVLLNITGASIGRCCVFPGGIGEANVNQHVCSIRLVDSAKSKSTVLSAFLASSFGQRQIDRFNAGGSREGLNYEQVRSILTIVSPDAETDLIADALVRADERILTEEALLKKLMQQKAGLMDDLLTGQIRVTPLLNLTELRKTEEES